MRSPRLLSLAVHSRTPGGLSLPLCVFGDVLTAVGGENGAGKTAVMCSLFWALGGSRAPDEPIWTQCSGAELQMRSATGVPTTIFRSFSSSFQASVSALGNTRDFDNEKDFSAEVRAILGFPDRAWVTSKGGTTSPYMSVLLPGFAIAQDGGWSRPYAPYANFVKDQEEEVSRLLLGLEPRHDAARDELRRKLLRRLETTQSAVDVRTEAIDALASEINRTEGRELAELHASRSRLQEELASFDGVVTTLLEATAGLSARADEARRERDAVRLDLSRARQRLAGLEKLMSETHGDLDVVGSNEVAAQTFRRFCDNSSCAFFTGSASNASYGRRVLYLRDQLKDLQTALKSADGQVETLERQLEASETRLNQLRLEFGSMSGAGPAKQISVLVDSVSKELARVASGIAFREQLEKSEQERASLVDRVDSIERELLAFDTASRARKTHTKRVQSDLQKAISRWLIVLRTNKDVGVGINEELRVTVRGNVMSDKTGPSGSSRLRVVLAFHAARLEVALSMEAHHPGFLLFDAPKQHEIDSRDFEAYFEEVRKLAERFPGRVQIVVSSKTPIPVMRGDEEWMPRFPPGDGDDHPWYFGTLDEGDEPDDGDESDGRGFDA